VLSQHLATDGSQVPTAEMALSALPHNARIGTSSLRRTALLKRLRPDLQCMPVRGNVATRLKKCDDGEVDALILAAAGLERLGYQDRIHHCFASDVLLPAACQGILAIQCRSDDASSMACLENLVADALHAQATAEQALCAARGANCQTPIGAHAPLLPKQQLQLNAWVASLDGSVCLQASAMGAFSDATQLGQMVGQDLYAQGAEQLLR
jgi:hydroxymethylbilane synthase